MNKYGAEKSPFSKVDHIGVIVRDMDKAIEQYQALGIGPFEPLSETPTDRKLYGKPADDIRNKVRVAQMGNIRFELAQPVSGESIQKEFLERRGEGINHLSFAVDDLDKEVAKLAEKGFKVAFRGKFQEGGGFAYFDTDKVGGVIFALEQLPPE